MTRLAWIVALCMLSLTAHADEAAVRRAEADKLFVRGSVAWEAGEYLVALEMFQKAYSIFPSPNLRYNMGRALSDLGRDLEALEAFEEFLASAKDAPDKARATARAKIAVLNDRVGRLDISCTAPGAEILVDGKVVGQAPLSRAVRVDPRPHQIAAQLPGFEPAIVVGAPRPGETLGVQLKLHKTDAKPLKKRWWFWTVLGTTVAASATAIALGVHYGVQSAHPITIHTDTSMGLTKSAGAP